MPVVILQPTCVYGPYAKDFGSAPLEDIRTGHFYLFEEGRAVANLVYIDNLIDAILLASERPVVSGSRYIVNEDGEATTWRDFYGVLSHASFNLSAIDFASIRCDELAGVCARWRRRHGFPDVFREAVRASPAAAGWLADRSWFQMWRRWRSRKQPVAVAALPAAAIQAAPCGSPQGTGHHLVLDGLMSQSRLFVNESTGRFFTSSAVYSTARIRADLGWSPRVPRDAALQSTARWAAHAYEHRQPLAAVTD